MTTPVHQARAPDGRGELAWTSTGQGTPLLLIAGLGLDGSSWWRSVAAFAERFRVITFDYRGLGRSGPAPPYCTTADLADDAAAVLDAADVERALVYGFSLGGMATQRLALRHPDRVSALVLGATTAGGAGVVHPGPSTVANLWRSSFLSPQTPPRRPSPTPTGSAVAARRRNASPPTSSTAGTNGSIPTRIADRSARR